MKKKIFIALGISFAIVLSITAIFLNVYGGTPTFKQGETPFTFIDEKLYYAVKDNLENVGIDYSDYEEDGKFGSNNKGKGYISLTPENITLVENLNLSGYEISNISGLEGFTNLKVLNLANNSISNVDILRNSTLKDTIEALNLNNNSLDNNQIKELSVISNLKELYISGMGFSSNEDNVNFINGLTELTYLDISNNGFNSISSLSLTKLKYLNISNNEIEDISIIQNDDKFANLHTLVTNYNLLDDADVATIKTRTSLKALGIAGNKITKIGDLKYLTNLEELAISSNYITDANLSGLENLSNLKTLNAGFIGISNLNKVRLLTNLESLDISGNNIENVEDITSLTNLMYLDVSANKISSISDETYNLLNNISSVNLSNQIFSQSVEGLMGQTKEITLPSIFKKAYLLAKEQDAEYSDDNYFLISNVTFNEDKSKITVDPYFIATSGGIVQVMDGPFVNSYITITGTSVSYELDRTGKREINQNTEDEDTAEEYSRIVDLETQLNEKLGVSKLEDFDLNKLSKYIGNNEDTQNNNSSDEEEENETNKLIATYMDFNTDGEIDESDYYRLYNYINGNINFLYTAETIDSIPTNEDVIIELVSTDYDVEMSIENGIKRLEQNGNWSLSYKKNGTTKTLSSRVNFIDKTAPTYTGPTYTETRNTAEDVIEAVTVTIKANEDIADIYSEIEESKDEDDTEPDQYEDEEDSADEKIVLEGWKLSEDKRTITKLYNSNEEETVIIQDIAGNITEINVKVENITIKEKEDTGALIMKYNDANGEDYDVNSWTNQNIYLDIDEEAKGEAYYKVNGGDAKYNATTLTAEGEYTVELYNKDENGQEEVNTYKVKIDKTAPEAGDIEIYENDEDGTRLYNGDITSDFVYISLDNENTEDEEADRTVFTIDGREELDVSTMLEDIGTHTIQVITYDRAGNKTLGNKYTIRIN